MWIITRKAIDEFIKRHPNAKSGLEDWYIKLDKAQWTNITQVRTVFPSADLVDVDSGNKVVVFDIGHNNFRLVAKFHFNWPRVYILKIMDHKEYSKNKWKENL